MAQVKTAQGNHDGRPVWLEVIKLGRNDWRVSDSRIDEAEPARLLGYVERLDRDRYEVLWMSEPVRWAYVSSLRVALAAFAEEVQFDGSIEAERDPSIQITDAFSLRRRRRRIPSNRPDVPRVA